MTISDEDGAGLVRMARRAVTEVTRYGSVTRDAEFESRFGFHAGVFVTLSRRGSLRGCIGFPMPVRRLAEGLVDAAVSAATMDGRFEPVDADEVGHITFEVTVLSRPEEILVDDASEYPGMIRMGVDGLIVENGPASGLLLPQVPEEYGWDETEFLEHACKKAGLPGDAWHDASTRISRFQGVIFREDAPGGAVRRR